MAETETTTTRPRAPHARYSLVVTTKDGDRYQVVGVDARAPRDDRPKDSEQDARWRAMLAVRKHTKTHLQFSPGADDLKQVSDDATLVVKKLAAAKAEAKADK